jgi:methylated-DNA-[protein]-cysteine S-methyltransferase
MSTFTAIINSPLGFLQLCCDDQSITAIKFADATTGNNSNNPLLIDCITQLDEYFSGKRICFDLPLSQPGTEFQKKIWSLLMKIPFGKTLSYKQLTTQFGDMKAIRAVASANGKNDLAIVVPCHRVIGTNGSLTGYAGGLWRKKWLLDHEAKFRQGGLF